MTDAMQASADRFWNWFTNVPVKHRAEAPAVADLMEDHNFSVQHTGGGCLAFEHTVDADWYLWLTDGDCGLPVDANESAYFGAYHVDGWHLCLEETTTAVAVTVMQTVTNVAQHLFGASAEESIRTMRDVLALASREGLVATFEADAVAAVLMAVPVAPSVLSPIDALAEEYSVWLQQEGLPDMSADELIAEDEVTLQQRAWLFDFLDRWAEAEEARSKAARTRVDELAADLEDDAMPYKSPAVAAEGMDCRDALLVAMDTLTEAQAMYDTASPERTAIDRSLAVLQCIVQQRGCEHLDPAVRDGRLTHYMDIVIFG